MIKFKLDRKNMGSLFFKNNEWVFEDGFLKAFSSPALEHFSISTKSSTAFIVREKNSKKSTDHLHFLNLSETEYSQKIEETKNWQLEYILIEINNKNSTILINRSAIDKVAIYYTLTENHLVASWDLTDLHKFIDKSDPFNRDELFLFITGIPIYNNKTIYKNIFKITGKSEILFSGNGVEVFLPESAKFFKESTLKPEIDPVEAFHKILENQLSHYQALKDCSANKIGCELSGGLDSAIVNTVVSDFFNKNGTGCYTLILPGEMGAQQEIRIKEIIEDWNLKASNIRTDNVRGPLQKDGFLLRNNMISVYEEIYYDFQSALLEKAEKNGVKIIFNGIGGDDVIYSLSTNNKIKQKEDFQNYLKNLNFLPNIHELNDILQKAPAFPASFIPVSALNASHSRSAMYLRKNMWPIELFCSKDIISFFQLLPKNIKGEKKLHKELLKSKGLSDLFVSPKLRENFEQVFNKAMKIDCRKEITDLISKSKLHEMGIIQKDIFLEQYKKYCETNDTSVPPIIYYTISAIEYNLISLHK